MIQLTLDIEPVAKARPRFTRYGRTYTPKKTADYEAQIRAAFTAKYKTETVPMWCRDTPLVAIASFGKSIPKSYSKKKRGQCLSGEIAPTSKPDVDNYLKAVLDALNGLAFEDDSQIVRTVAEKQYSEAPFVQITIRRDK
jgi:Holliday junction resolvase RusA-like endonuclease